MKPFDFQSGLLYLAASVACSVIVSVLLKLARGVGHDVRQIIFANYICAAILCWLIFVPAPIHALAQIQDWPLALALAALLPTVFIALAWSVRQAGIVRSDAAQRLSMFISLLAAFALFGEPLAWRKGLAMLAALAALVCLLRRAGKTAGANSQWLWPLAVWVGFGVIDVLFKKLSGTAFTHNLLAIFALAAALMLLYLLAARAQWRLSALLIGLLVGVANFGNIYTYLKAHQLLSSKPALVFAAMPMGVIVLGTLVGALVFGERLSRVNWLGLALALAAIAVMMPI